MLNLLDEKSVKANLDALESQTGLLKMEIGQTPVFFLDPAHGGAAYIHWVEVDGNTMHVACAGSQLSPMSGFAPDVCPVCAVLKARYSHARQLEAEGKAEAGEKYRKVTNNFKARYEARFVVAKGEVITMKTPEGQKVKVADFDNAEVGVIALSEKQFKDLMAIAGSTTFDYVKDNVDLFKRAIIFDKSKKKDTDKFPTTDFIPGKRYMEDKIEWKAEDYNVTDFTVIKADELETAAAYLKGVKAVVKKEAVEYDDAPAAGGDEVSDEDFDAVLGTEGEGSDFDDLDFTDPAEKVSDKVVEKAPSGKAGVQAQKTAKKVESDF